MTTLVPPAILGIDFGTTNSVAAIAIDGEASLVPLQGPEGEDPVFRSALCFWEDEAGIAVEAGPWAVAEYLAYPEGSRFIQSFKTVAASPHFLHASIFDRRYRFEDLGALFLKKMLQRSGVEMAGGNRRVVIGRPVVFAGHRPDEALAHERYSAVFGALSADVSFVYEPLGAAFSFASGLQTAATVLVADFGGGTSDFSIVRIEAPGQAKRCTPLSHAGVGIAGDRFDHRILDHLVLPLLGKGGQYRSFDKVLEIPSGWFAEFADWSRLAFMRNRKTLTDLTKLQRSAIDPAPIGKMISIIEQELGYALYDAVGKVKRALSSAETAQFAFSGGGLSIEAEVSRADFERWIAPDLQLIEEAVDLALSRASMVPAEIDRVFLTGGSSLVPCVRRLFSERFGHERIASGNELTSIAHGLALIGGEPDLSAWAI
jgi:hypothetical chaperone protein